ncbi:MAG: hypothetical protein K9L84_03500 [Candidatus Omnitrophica bacterium]|nr:hypothetical protein [Candidatus Omnitrophota bacterium]MCF7894104.1 hypothetical protein [Candidatus Omnitrophota bacterium]
MRGRNENQSNFILFLTKKKAHLSFKCLIIFLISAFLLSALIPFVSRNQPKSYASTLPAPDQLLEPTPNFVPPMVRGLRINPANPFEFNFIVDTGDRGDLSKEELKKESEELIRYFLASLTVPEDDLWVNLSPYEKDRIIPSGLGQTDLGRELLGQDYILKQLLSSLTYPESPSGKKFWDKVYKKAYQKYGTTNIPINTFNKIWIVPAEAQVYENGNTGYVTKAKLKVMLEQDYLALDKNLDNKDIGTDQLDKKDTQELSGISSKVTKEIILPAIAKEINEGKNFASLRQVYSALILAIWFKQKLKKTILSEIYLDKNKIKGVELEDKQAKDKIYARYVKAYKKGVYDFIKTDYDPHLRRQIRRQYYSGGFDGTALASNLQTTPVMPATGLPVAGSSLGVGVKINPVAEGLAGTGVTGEVQGGREGGTGTGADTGSGTGPGTSGTGEGSGGSFLEDLTTYFKKTIPELLIGTSLTLGGAFSLGFISGMYISSSLSVLGYLVGMSLGARIAWSLNAWLQTKLFNFLKTTKYMTAYKEGKKITLHVLANLNELKKQNNPYQAIFKDSLIAIEEVLNRIETEPQMKGIISIEATSPLLWRYKKRPNGSIVDKPNPVFESYFSNLDNYEFKSKPLGFIGKLTKLAVTGFGKDSIKSFKPLFSKDKEGRLIIDVSSSEKRNNIRKLLIKHEAEFNQAERRTLIKNRVGGESEVKEDNDIYKTNSGVEYAVEVINDRNNMEETINKWFEQAKQRGEERFFKSWRWKNQAINAYPNGYLVMLEALDTGEILGLGYFHKGLSMKDENEGAKEFYIGDFIEVSQEYRKSQGFGKVILTKAIELSNNDQTIAEDSKGIIMVHPAEAEREAKNIPREYFEQLGFRVAASSTLEFLSEEDAIDNTWMWLSKDMAERIVDETESYKVKEQIPENEESSNKIEQQLLLFDENQSAGGSSNPSPEKAPGGIDNKGGIDLTPAQINLDVQGQGINSTQLQLPFDLQTFQGFTFNIIKIETIDNLGQIFGQANNKTLPF